MFAYFFFGLIVGDEALSFVDYNSDFDGFKRIIRLKVCSVSSQHVLGKLSSVFFSAQIALSVFFFLYK